MQYPEPLIAATLIRRYKRFLADVHLDSGEVITVHTPNTGAMSGCAEPGSRVWLRDTRNSQRKHRYAWEMSEPLAGTLVCVNTHLANQLVREAIASGVIAELQGYTTMRSEVRFGAENSRVDILLQDCLGQRCFVEVKNVTALDAHGIAMFPDAVSARGAKHLRELARVLQQGDRAAIVYCVARGDAHAMRAASEIDPDYAQAFQVALGAGVEALAYRARPARDGIALERRLPLVQYR